MEPYHRFLCTYVSLSGPHLGYLYSSNSLFNSGLWLLKKLKNTQCIHQLTFTDDVNLRNTFFYKLCKVSIDSSVLYSLKLLDFTICSYFYKRMRTLLSVISFLYLSLFSSKRHWKALRT